MEFTVIILVLALILVVLKTIYKINIKEIKNIGENNKKLDEIASKYPSNYEICKHLLKKLNNEEVKIYEDTEKDSCLYIAVSNKIIIANMRNSFTRIQTIAHECLHSIQDREILLFNFIYSNIYMLYFIIVAIFGLFKVLPNKMLFFNIFIILGFVYYFIRSYLENDAMIKARFLAKEYMEEQEISTENEIKKIVYEYDKLNHLGVKAVNFQLLLDVSIKTMILSLIMLIR